MGRIQEKSHQIGILVRVFIVTTENADRSKALFFEENLGVEISFTYFEKNLVPTLLGQLVDQTRYHLGADRLTAEGTIHGKIQNMQTRFMQFINHEADDFVIEFGNHPYAVSLTQAAEKILFIPGMIETFLFDP